jgi:hypothetical protein
MPPTEAGTSGGTILDRITSTTKLTLALSSCVLFIGALCLGALCLPRNQLLAAVLAACILLQGLHAPFSAIGLRASPPPPLAARAGGRATLVALGPGSSGGGGSGLGGAGCSVGRSAMRYVLY